LRLSLGIFIFIFYHNPIRVGKSTNHETRPIPHISSIQNSAAATNSTAETTTQIYDRHDRTDIARCLKTRDNNPDFTGEELTNQLTNYPPSKPANVYIKTNQPPKPHPLESPYSPRVSVAKRTIVQSPSTNRFKKSRRPGVFQLRTSRARD